MLEKDADMEILKTTLQRKVDPASFIPSNAKSGNVIFASILAFTFDLIAVGFDHECEVGRGE